MELFTKLIYPACTVLSLVLAIIALVKLKGTEDSLSLARERINSLTHSIVAIKKELGFEYSPFWMGEPEFKKWRSLIDIIGLEWRDDKNFPAGFYDKAKIRKIMNKIDKAKQHPIT